MHLPEIKRIRAISDLAGLFTFLLLFFGSCHAGQSSQNEKKGDSMVQQYRCPVHEELKVFALEEDILIFERTIETFENKAFDNTTFNELLISLASHFLKTPYKASTLEIPGEEQLVVNLRDMDCTTFVEYVFALALTVKSEDMSFGHFTQLLTCIRYRNGLLNKYPSRLHYFTEWLQNNQQKGLITLLSDSIGTTPFDAAVGFMSKNPNLYRQLENRTFVDSIALAERRIEEYKMNYIPKQDIRKIEHQIKDGDIIAFTTNIAGLDVSHSGFALHQNGRLHLLHASTRTNQVEITPIPLSDYLGSLGKVTGILVARTNERE